MDANQTRLDQYGCFTTAGKEEKDGQCTVIDFQTGSKKAHPMKGMDLCSALPVIGECVMNDMIALATKASEAIGVYVRVDMFVGPNNEIYVQEFSTNHMSGFRHCSAIKDENNCIDPCFQGRMWKNTGSSTFGGTETDILPELHSWLNLTSDDACTDIELSTPIVATPESSCSNTPAPIPRAPPTPIIVISLEPKLEANCNSHLNRNSPLFASNCPYSPLITEIKRPYIEINQTSLPPSQYKTNTQFE
jgi:hypothetical protein